MRKIVASVLVRNQMVVNSTLFTHYKPIGSIEQIILRLQELEIDEITVLNLTHSENPLQDFGRSFPMTFSQQLALRWRMEAALILKHLRSP